MPADRDQVIRVGIRLVLVAFAAGLLVLALSGSALSRELPQPKLRPPMMISPERISVANSGRMSAMQ